ncbi:cyclic lactone autoinducer peptide [Andreesenia angusta]|uniref:cyclic lactone autoinducer peptide n=1 Tax=Andreesenia angusta TaxID=39480 RepID=UPI000A072832
MKKLLKIICNFLISFAPNSLNYTACLGFWGEPECPEELKSEVQNSSFTTK